MHDNILRRYYRNTLNGISFRRGRAEKGSSMYVVYTPTLGNFIGRINIYHVVDNGGSPASRKATTTIYDNNL